MSAIIELIAAFIVTYMTAIFRCVFLRKIYFLDFHSRLNIPKHKKIGPKNAKNSITNFSSKKNNCD